MPISGEVVAVNERLSSEPELVNDDCYGEGWMMKIKLTNPTELKDALSSDQYKEFVVE
jgi:glycine cleavage system H protein